MASVNMSRRRLSLALPCGLAAPALAAPPGGPRPNILFIQADDLDYEIFSHMVKVRQLITEPGMEFVKHYCSLPLCVPSRVTMLRGQYAHNTRVMDNRDPYGGFDRFFQDGLESSTVATWLQGSGYRTGYMGKYLNGYPGEAVSAGLTYIPPGWTDWFVPNGGDEYRQLIYTVNDNGNTLSFNGDPKTHFHDVMTQQAVRFLRQAANDPVSRPFFLCVNPYLPHGPSMAPARYLQLLPDVRLPRPPNFNELDVSDKPRWVKQLPLLDEATIAQMGRLYRRRRQSALALDDMAQALVQALQSTGQLDNTYVFFTSDNGHFQGQHRIKGDKKRVYDENLRVPLVLRGPGIAAGRTVSHLTANVDLASTIAAMAGVTPPGFVDGRSLKPLFRGPGPARWRQTLLLECQPPEVNSVYQSYAGLRTTDDRTFALFAYGFGEYYDMRTDPYQLVNRHAALPPEVRTAFRVQLRSMRDAAGAALRRAEETMVPRA
ncbi:sulfatase family protein [Azohydromonas caseinilytica]|uniref:Sulfatase n=1 Tax=Azohydromonas caseinilytica TaxID=2728836 RepID=A0A848FKH5_9BURK|nr:sulfatase [Azohydromonas caseinilytica]NML18743.1 sulfatase [Azohydromonas caseinilytica]